MKNSMQTICGFIFCLLCVTSNNALSGVPQPTVHTIRAIPPNGIEINEPGKYVFTKNISWSPKGYARAIVITANDVTLDFQDHTLTSSQVPFTTIGILATSVENLVIKNGSIANMSFQGIQCDKCTNVVIKNFTINGLNIQNTATYTVPVGILVNESVNATINNCVVKNIKVKTGSTAAIQLTKTISSKVMNCVVKNLLNKDGACTGIGHLLCDNAEVTNCTLDRLRSTFIDNLNTEGHTAIGIIPVGSTNLLIQNCKISNIKGCCDDAHGMSVFECLNAVVKNCKVKNVLDGAGNAQTGAKATGIEIYASGVQVLDCKVKNITAINPQDKQATGFSCAQSLGVSFIGCRAENVRVVDEHGKEHARLGFGTGFGWAPDPRSEFIAPAVGTLYKNCIAKKCQVGFDSWFHQDSTWDQIHSYCNQIPILNQSNAKRTLSCSPCSECGCSQAGCTPNPLVVTISNVAVNNTFLNVKIKSCK